jgi:hypothetical protein
MAPALGREAFRAAPSLKLLAQLSIAGSDVIGALTINKLLCGNALVERQKNVRVRTTLFKQ